MRDRLTDLFDGLCGVLSAPFAFLRRPPSPFDYPDACPPAGVRCAQCGTMRGCEAPDG